MIFFTTSSGCSDGKKNRYMRDVGCVTVENMDVSTCPGSTRVVLISGHLYLRSALVGSRSRGGNKSITLRRVRSEESRATKSELLWKHSSRLHKDGIRARLGKGSRSVTHKAGELQISQAPNRRSPNLHSSPVKSAPTPIRCSDIRCGLSSP